MRGHKSAPLDLPASGKNYFEEREDPEYEAEKLGPSPDDESFPEKINEEAGHSVLVGRCEEGDDPWDDVALRRDALALEMITNFWMEDCQ